MMGGALPDGTPVIISGEHDGTVRVWRTADGTPVGEPLTGHDGPVTAVAAGALPDGTPVIIISGGRDTQAWGSDGTVRVWRTADGTPAGEPLAGHDGPVTAVAAGALLDGTPVIISGGGDTLAWGSAGTVRVWRTADGTPVGEPLTGHDGPVTAVAAGALPDGTPVAISGDRGGTVRVWRTADGTPVGEPLTGYGGAVSGVTAVAAGALLDGTPVIIISGGRDTQAWGSDGTVRVWRTADGTSVGDPLTGHGQVSAVAVAALPDGTPVIITSGGGTLGVWRLADGTRVGEPLAGHEGVTAVVGGALLDGTPVIISGGGDGTVRVWRLADRTQVGEPLTGHDGPVTAVAAGALPDGTPVIISGGRDRTVRVWRTTDGAPLVPPLDLPESVKAIAIDGNVIITAAGADIAVHQPALASPVRLT